MRYLILVLFIGCSNELPTAPDINLKPKKKEKGYVVYRKVQELRSSDTTKTQILLPRLRPKILLQTKEDTMSPTDPITLCPVCQKRLLVFQDRWVELKPYLLTAIEERDIPVKYRRCPKCQAGIQELARKAQEQAERNAGRRLFSLWASTTTAN